MKKEQVSEGAGFLFGPFLSFAAGARGCWFLLSRAAAAATGGASFFRFFSFCFLLLLMPPPCVGGEGGEAAATGAPPSFLLSAVGTAAAAVEAKVPFVAAFATVSEAERSSVVEIGGGPATAAEE